MRPHVEAGKIVPLGMSSAQRLKSFPNVPTFTEASVKGMEADAWIGMWVTAGTPAPIIARLNGTLATVLSNPAVRKKFDDMFAEAVHMDGARFQSLLVDEEKTLSTLIRERNIRVE